jgi:hypothetical protein
MRTKKSRTITADQVLVEFDDACVEKLAQVAKLPPGADMAAFAEGTREAARIYARDARIPNVNDLHDEIEQLHKAAERQRYEVVADLLERLSPRGRDMLTERGYGVTLELPSSDALRDPAQREAACGAIAQLCQYGGCKVQGPPSKGLRQKWSPYFHAPDKQRNFPKRGAERDFVMWLQLAWAEATGKIPAQTARHVSGVGPFARFARDCLRLVGAADADVVELINGLHQCRREMERSHTRPPK